MSPLTPPTGSRMMNDGNTCACIHAPTYLGIMDKNGPVDFISFFFLTPQLQFLVFIASFCLLFIPSTDRSLLNSC
jgi:hypothetical protein